MWPFADAGFSKEMMEATACSLASHQVLFPERRVDSPAAAKEQFEFVHVALKKSSLSLSR